MKTEPTKIPPWSSEPPTRTFFHGSGWVGARLWRLSELLHFCRRELPEDVPGELAQERVAESVDALEVAEKEDEPLEMRGRELAVDAVKRVRDGVGDRLLLQEGLEVENVLTQPDDLAVLDLVQAPGEQIYFAWVLREISRNLLTDKCIGMRGNRETTLDGVVVGDGDEVHPAALDGVVVGDGDEVHPGFLGADVKIERIGVAIGEIEPAKDPILGSIAEFRVQMKVAAGHVDPRRFGGEPIAVSHRLARRSGHRRSGR